MASGTVSWYNPAKGYGVIALDNGGPDVSVDKAALERAAMAPLQEGQRLTFEVISDRRGPKAVDLSPLE